MTNSFQSFALKALGAASFAVLLCAGCGPQDGSKEFAEGQTAYGVRNLEKAERLFAKSFQLSRANVDACVMLARVQADLGKIAEASETIAQAVALAPDAPDVALLDAEIAYYADDCARAAKRFRGVAENVAVGAPAQSLGWTGLGIVEMSCNQLDVARIAFLRAIRLDFRNPSAHYHLGFLYRGDAFNNLAAAREEFRIFVRLGEPSDPRVVNVQRVIIPGIDEDIARAKASRPGAARRNATDSAAALKRADAAWKKNDFKAARREYEAAYKADVLSVPAALGLAQTWEKTDASGKEALKYYKEACALSSSPSIKTLLAAGVLAAKIAQHQTAVEMYSRAVAADSSNITAIDGLIRALRKVGNGKIADAYQRYRDSISERKTK